MAKNYCVNNQASTVYTALQRAAERIGQENYKAGLYRVKRRRGKVVAGYRITEEHKRVIEAMPKVCSGKMSAEEGMALLHEYDIFQARFPVKKKKH